MDVRVLLRRIFMRPSTSEIDERVHDLKAREDQPSATGHVGGLRRGLIGAPWDDGVLDSTHTDWTGD